MRPVSLLFAAAGLLIAAPGMADAQPTFEQALSRIRHNVEVFETQLPDFVCTEKITSRTVAEQDGSVEKETVIESTFSGRQNHSALSKLGGLSFKEERQIETVNGARWGEKTMPRGVFHVSGGYSSILVMIFGSKGEANYSFSPAEPDQGSSEPAFVVAFTTKNGKQKVREKNGTSSFQATGRAWFDPVSFEVIRLEERILAKADEPGDELPVTVEYRPVQIGEGQFRLPVRVSATAHREVAGKAERGEYLAEYSDYRKYGASSTIHYPNLEPH
jgi:hypothetical protein